MKSISKTMLLVCGLTSLTGAAFGAMETRAIMNIPFEFVAGGKRLPAGEYRFSADSNNGLILVQGAKPGQAAALITIPGARWSPDGATTVNFERVAGEPHMTELLIQGQVARTVKVKPVKEALAGVMASGH